MHTQLELHRRGMIISTALLVLILIQSQSFASYSNSRPKPATAPAISARSDDRIVLLFSSLPGGIARGQKLRITLSNLIRLEGREQNPVEVRANAKLLDSLGRNIAQTGEVPIPLGQFRSFEFNRDALSPSGDPDTGRLEVLDELTVRCIGLDSAEAATVMQEILKLLPATCELIDNATGKSHTSNACLPISSWFETRSLPKPNTTGLANGQTLGFTILNPGSSSSSEILGRISLADQYGTVIAQSDAVTIAPGEFHSFHFKREDIPSRGESGTGRLQLAWTVEMGVNAEVPVALSIEVVESASGISSGSKAAYVYVAVPLNQG